MRGVLGLVVSNLTLFATVCIYAQTINTTCTLYPNAAYCTSSGTDSDAAAVAREQQYQTGQSVGNSIGMAIFRAHFPGWRVKYCSTHPNQPFYYGNASGDSITGTCPTLQGLSNEAAAAFIGKHPGAITSQEQAAALDKYVSENHLASWEPKSYEQALKMVTTAAPSQKTTSPAQASAAAQDIFIWFDEPFPGPGASLTEVLVTSRAFDGAVAMLRQVRQGNTSVKAGRSVLEADYHPSTISLSSWHKSNPAALVGVFYWNGEVINDSTPVMHFRMTKRRMSKCSR